MSVISKIVFEILEDYCLSEIRCVQQLKIALSIDAILLVMFSEHHLRTILCLCIFGTEASIRTMFHSTSDIFESGDKARKLLKGILVYITWNVQIDCDFSVNGATV